MFCEMSYLSVTFCCKEHMATKANVSADIESCALPELIDPVVDGLDRDPEV